MKMRSLCIPAIMATVAASSCAKPSSLASPSSINPISAIIADASSVASAGGAAKTAGHGRPEYGLAYYNGRTVVMNEIDVPQNPGVLTHAAADLYAVIYPPNHTLWPSPPQCNPCDHNGNGDDLPDFHDHVLDSIPADPGHGEFSPLWHVLVILPADFSPATQAAYAARLPMTSEATLDAAIAAGVAREVDTGGYFICAIVDPNAAK